MKAFWNERYAQEEFIYGTSANEFLCKNLEQLPAGKIILPCDGEGRNSVFAAQQGWKVQAFDYSLSAQVKANALAAKKEVSIDFEVADIRNKQYEENSTDVIAFIYAHLPPDLRKIAHQKAIKWLKPGGKIIMEAFNPKQIENNSGGPKSMEMLYTEEMLQEDFKGLKIVELTSIQTKLSEGKSHDGIANVIRLIAIKE